MAPGTVAPFNSHWKVGVPPFTGVAVKVTVVPAQIAPAGDAAIVTDGTAAACNDKEAQFVAGDNPAIPAEEVGLILPAAEVVLVAWICTPLTEKKSVIEVPLVVTLMVIVVAVMPPSVIAVIFRPGRKLNVIAAAVLNTQPVGVLSTSECGPVVISLPKPSEKTILPRVLNAGVLPSCARLEQMLVPPVPGVTVIAAFEVITLVKTNAAISIKNFFILSVCEF